MSQKITLSIFLCLGFYFLFTTDVAHGAEASLKLLPNVGNFEVGKSFEVKVELDTGGVRTSGTDLYLTFDPKELNLLTITPGTIYSQSIGRKIDNTTGKASLSGLVSSGDNLFSGSGTFAVLNFKALSTGTTEVEIDFTLGNRNDSNVADFDAQGDALGSVTNATFTLQGGMANLTPTLAPTVTSTLTPTPTFTAGAPVSPVAELPGTANEKPTLIVAWLGIILFAGGLAFLCPSFLQNKSSS